jgi:hypothetical protein
MTCRDEILAAIAQHKRDMGSPTFSIADILKRMAGSAYTESTIRTHITSRMSADATTNHETKYDDLERLDRGVYRLKVLSGSQRKT